MKTYRLGSGQARSKRWLYATLAIIFLGGYAYWCLGRPLPPLQPSASDIRVQAPASTLAWPAVGQSAVGIVGSPVLEAHGKQQPTPTASTAKLITILVVLQEKPLSPGEQGPTITLTQNDVNIYNAYLAHDGSLVQVQAGERITEYQMLQAILLPSANNMADSLAIWAFGSLKNYTQAANQFLENQGLVETHVETDASGFSPNTTSTARDLVRIGELAMQNPVVKQIVAQPTASGIPVVNNIKNVNFLLGSYGIIGIKTGNTDQAGGVYISASQKTVNGKPVTLVTALADSPTLFQALKDSVPLVQSAQANFKPVTVVEDGSIVGNYKQPWGGSVPAVAGKALSLEAWQGASVTAKVSLRPMPPNAPAGQTAGSVSVPPSPFSGRVSVPAILKSAPTKPSAWWRLTHPF